jgi:cytochrome b561
MRFRDSGLHFGLVSVVGHWAGVAILLAFLISALVSDLTGSDFDSTRDVTLRVALLTAPFFAFRLYWRVSNFHPAPLGGANPAQVLAGRGVAMGMLLAGVVLPIMYWVKEVLAPASSWWLTPLFWLGVACFFGGLALHLYGAFIHVFILKDDSLKRLMGNQVDL